jgi:uncharacterized protein YecT (DUF1311 family)
MRLAVVLLLSACAGLVRAETSCIDTAADRQAFEECAQKEMLPLEAKVVSRFAALRTKYRNDPDAREALEKSQDSWNAYRNSHCAIEAKARGAGSEVEVQRVFAACARRKLESRLKELESL